jgi:hypothetical protein
MTDELETLRRRNGELERQLIKTSLRTSLELELRRRGLAPDRVEDALLLMGAEHEPATHETIGTAAVWHTKDDPKLRTLAKVVDSFQEGRGYLFPSTSTERSAATYAPTYENGSPIPVAQMTDIELSIAAGPTPEAQPATLPSFTDEQFENLSVLDRLAVQAGHPPEVKQSDAGIAEVNAELEARAKYREETNQQQMESGTLPMLQTKKARGQS